MVGIFVGRASRKAAAAALLIAASSVGPAQAVEEAGLIEADEPVVLDYSIYFGGFHVLDARATLRAEDDTYEIEAEAQTEGFARWLFSWRGEARSAGRIADGRITPQVHRNWGDAGGSERLTELAYDGDGNVVDVYVDPERDPTKVHPLPEDAEVGTIDPLSLVIESSLRLSRGEVCDGRRAVFDGKRRYDVILTQIDETEIEPNSYSVYAGPAVACIMEYEQLGGHRLKRNKYEETARDRTIWVARPLSDGPVVPVRLRIETAYGMVMGHLTGMAVGGRDVARAGSPD